MEPSLNLIEALSKGNILGFGTPLAKNTRSGDPWVSSLANRKELD